ncbi:MAG: glycosyltransferase [Actinomycetota bacterium]|nr:glycosyltransferase [Actinomycetota bacterium]
MRIAYLTGRYPAVTHTFILREVHALRRLGVEVHTHSIWRTGGQELLSSADQAEASATQHLLPPHLAEVLQAHTHALRSRPRGLLSVFARAATLGRPGIKGRAMSVLWALEAVTLWHRLERAGLRHIHAHLNGTAPTVALLAVALANAGAPEHRWTWSLTVHGPSEFYDVSGERVAEKVRDADLVVAISDFARSQLMALVDEEHWQKIRIVHCGVDATVFSPNSALRPGAPLRVLTISRLAPTKGTAVLLQALALLRRRGVNAEAVVVGDGVRRAALEKLAERLGIAGQVRFVGAVGQDRIRDYYAAADVFCLPSFAEGVPVVLMEAMAMEVPVVATAIMGVPELVEHDRSGILVPPGRADAVADALALFASDPKRRAALGRAGRAKIIAEFDVNRSAERLRNLFAAALNDDREFPITPGEHEAVEPEESR